jgi:hypothetical protein
MTREEAIQFLDNMRGNENGRAIGAEGFYAELCGYHVQALNMAIKALEHPEQNVIAVVPCGDCISRQAGLDLVGADWKYEGLESDIENLPSVNPQEPKMEHWILHTDASGNSWHACPACGHIAYTLTRFCPDCGAAMMEVHDDD